ncbi:hypothetical protein [Rhodococcus globerulus]|uniref:hypothetical protein n=1 Tax=Rhodococcus globerulus TaxID=33008 RepID=UPI003015E4D0
MIDLTTLTDEELRERRVALGGSHAAALHLIPMPSAIFLARLLRDIAACEAERASRRSRRTEPTARE